MRLRSRAPTRLDFGGGWTDVPPYPEMEGGFVCNLAIARYATAVLAPSANGTFIVRDRAELWSGSDLREPGGPQLPKAALRRSGLSGVELTLRSDFPAGAGLGGSSAAGVALAAVLAAARGEQPTPPELAERSRAVEVEELEVAGGRQDHYAAAFGGALALTFDARVDVRPIPLTADLIREIERRFIVAYTGESRISGETITAVVEAFRARDCGVVAALARMKELARMMASALDQGALDELGALVGEHWQHQRSLHERITTAGIEQVISAGTSAGILGAKPLGASGGGCVLLISRADTADAVREAVAEVSELVEFQVDLEGARVWRF